METEEVNQLKQVLNSNLEQLVQNQKNLQEISSYYQKLYSTQNAIDYEQTNTQARQYVIQGLNLILYQINILTKGISDYMVYQNSITDSIDFELNTINHRINSSHEALGRKALGDFKIPDIQEPVPKTSTQEIPPKTEEKYELNLTEFDNIGVKLEMPSNTFNRKTMCSDMSRTSMLGGMTLTTKMSNQPISTVLQYNSAPPTMPRLSEVFAGATSSNPLSAPPQLVPPPMPSLLSMPQPPQLSMPGQTPPPPPAMGGPPPPPAPPAMGGPPPPPAPPSMGGPPPPPAPPSMGGPPPPPAPPAMGGPPPPPAPPAMGGGPPPPAPPPAMGGGPPPPPPPPAASAPKPASGGGSLAEQIAAMSRKRQEQRNNNQGQAQSEPKPRPEPVKKSAEPLSMADALQMAFKKRQQNASKASESNESSAPAAPTPAAAPPPAPAPAPVPASTGGPPPPPGGAGGPPPPPPPPPVGGGPPPPPAGGVPPAPKPAASAPKPAAAPSGNMSLAEQIAALSRKKQEQRNNQPIEIKKVEPKPEPIKKSSEPLSMQEALQMAFKKRAAKQKAEEETKPDETKPAETKPEETKPEETKPKETPAPAPAPAPEPAQAPAPVEEEYGDLVIVLYDFKGSNPDEIDIYKDEYLRVTNWDIGEGWVFGYKSGDKQKEGSFPKAYVQRV